MNRQFRSSILSKLTHSPILVLLLSAFVPPATAQDLVISGVIDGPLSGGLPKAVEVYVCNDIADLSAYGLGSANNGGGTDGEEFSFPSDAATAGTYLYVATEDSSFVSFFGFAPQYTSSSAASINGDDAIELFMSGGVVDVFGDINTDGTGQPWEHLDGWAYRNNGTGPGGSAFNVGDWTYSGPNALDGETTNATAVSPFPLGTYTGCNSVERSPDLLLTEIVVTPTAGEFIEIFNPTGAAIDLSDVYLTDATFAGGGTYYYNIVTGSNAGGGGFGDFHARFPDGATIAPGEFQAVSLAGSDDFVATYGIDPTYELYEDGGSADGVPDMREALPGSINNQGGLTNSGEVVILYTWDGVSDLVQDIDYAVWGDKDEAVEKTGAVGIDGPDGDGDASFYVADTPIALQDILSTGAHAFGDSFQRIDFDEGTEVQTAGNGITGSDETSEDLSATWGSAAPTPGAAPPEPPEPPVVAVVINEIIQNPARVSDNNGEWFELVNATPDPVDVEGWTFKDNGSNFHEISNGGPLVIPPGGFLVLGRDNDPSINGGVTVDYQYSNTFLGNGSDALILANSAGGEVDRVEWDNGSSFPDPTGASMALKNPALDNSVGANWCESQTPFGDGDLGTPGAGNDCFANLVINEVDADDTGSDDEEFIEIYDGGAGNTDLSGLSIVLYNGSDDQTYDAFDLDGYATGVDGFFVLGSVVGNDLFVAPGWLQNGADAVTLYAGDAIDFPNDTPLTFDGLLDAVVYDTNDSDDAGLLVLLNGGQPQVNENGAGAKDIHSNQRCPNGFGGQRNTDAYVQDVPTPGSLNTCPPLEIYSIQGAGPASPYAGFVVSLTDAVVTAVAPDGFFVQTAGDGDSETSDGIFVFTGGAPGVAVGDLVDVEGEVSEFFGFTEIGGSPTVNVTGTGAVPLPVMFDATVPSPNPMTPSCSLEFECYEGMLVEIVNGTVTGPNQRFGTDPVAEVHITAAPVRTFREPGIEYPGVNMPPIPTWDGNPEVFELDPDRLGLENQIIPAGSSFSATGVLGYEFGGYELWPTSLDVTPAPLPRSVRAREAGELTVGTLNLFRLFDDVDDPASFSADERERDDFVVSTTEYQRRLAKLAAHVLAVLDAPEILAVQEAEKLGVLEDLSDLISAEDPSVSYSAYLEEGNDVGTIDVGFLVRERITVDSVTQLGKMETFLNPVTNEFDILHDRPPLLIEGSAPFQVGTLPIAVMVVHNRSLGGIDGNEAPRVRVKRLRQAESIAMKVQELQIADPDVRLVVTGDFNAFEFTDGYVDAMGIITGDFDPLDMTSLVCTEALCLSDIVEPNLENQVLWVPDNDRYSFIFRGSAQVLDHALTSANLANEISGVMFGRGNADAAVDLINDDGTLLRSSDHDGLVIFIGNDEDADGVPNDDDACPSTVLPETVPTVRLGTNRFADTDGDGVFNTTPPKGKGPKSKGPKGSFDLSDTAGCTCEQIIEAQGLGKGHTKFGCSIGAMKNWISRVTP